jgi:hypothetical protein
MLNVRTAKQFKKSPLAIYRAAIKLAAAYLSFSLSTARDEEGVNQAAKTRARETVDYLEADVLIQVPSSEFTPKAIRAER